MDNRLTDFSFFKQNSFGDHELYRELLAIFIRTTPEMVQHLQKALAEGDYTDMAKVAHKLKSNVQSVGLESLHIVLDRLENGKWTDSHQHEISQLIEAVEKGCKIAIYEAKVEFEKIVD